MSYEYMIHTHPLGATHLVGSSELGVRVTEGPYLVGSSELGVRVTDTELLNSNFQSPIIDGKRLAVPEGVEHCGEAT